MDSYEVLVIENGIYYIRYYPCGQEFRGMNMKLDEYDFYNFVEGKVEV